MTVATAAPESTRLSMLGTPAIRPEARGADLTTTLPSFFPAGHDPCLDFHSRYRFLLHDLLGVQQLPPSPGGNHTSTRSRLPCTPTPIYESANQIERYDHATHVIATLAAGVRPAILVIHQRFGARTSQCHIGTARVSALPCKHWAEPRVACLAACFGSRYLQPHRLDDRGACLSHLHAAAHR